MCWIRIPINCVLIINAIVLDGERYATTTTTVIRISSNASIPPTLKTARVGLTYS